MDTMCCSWSGPINTICSVVICSFSKLFTSSDKPSKKPNSSPSLSYKSTVKPETVRPVGDPNQSSREGIGGQSSRAFDFLQDDLYVHICN